AEQRLASHAEDRRVRADAERETHDRRRREGGAAANSARRVAEIGREILDPLEAPRGARVLLHPRGRAELAPRLEERRLPRHSAGLELIGARLEVETELRVEILVEASPSGEMGDAVEEFG